MELREKIHTIPDLPTEDVIIGEWEGMKLTVRSLTGRDRNRVIEKSVGKNNEMDTDALYINIIIACVCDPKTGERVFTEEDATWLPEKSGAALEKLATTAYRLNGIGESAIRDAEKNSPSVTRKKGSITDSPKSSG